MLENNCLCSDNRTGLMKSLCLRKLVFFFPTPKAIVERDRKWNRSHPSVRLLLCFTVLHHFFSTFPRYAIQKALFISSVHFVVKFFINGGNTNFKMGITANQNIYNREEKLLSADCPSLNSEYFYNAKT